jgi:hypothetical protein
MGWIFLVALRPHSTLSRVLVEPAPRLGMGKEPKYKSLIAKIASPMAEAHHEMFSAQAFHYHC